MPRIRTQPGAAPQGPLELHTLFGGTHHWFFNPDLEAPTYVADTSFDLPEQAGTGVTCIQSGAASPIYTAADSTLNNRPTFQGNGSSKYVPTSWNPPAPATTNVWFYALVKQISPWTNGHTLWAGLTTTHMRTHGVTSSPTVRTTNGGTASDSSGFTLGSWLRFWVLYTGVSGNDQIKRGSAATVTGLNLGNGNPTGFQFLANNGGSFGNWAIAFAYARVGKPSDALILQADAQITARYGTGVLL